MRKLGVLFLSVGLVLIGYTLLQDPEVQQRFVKNLGTVGVEARKLHPDTDLFFKNQELLLLAVQIIGYTLISSPVLVIRPLKFLALFHLVALVVLIGVLCVNQKKDDSTVVIYITKGLGVAGGLLYYLGC